MRISSGTQMAAAGAPLRAIQEWMGHADASTTEIYAHYALDPTGGAAFVPRAFGNGARSDLSATSSTTARAADGPPSSAT
jgi:hypothetical protein